MLITRWNRLWDPNGTEERISWQDLCAELSRIAPYQGEEKHPGWSPAQFKGQQRGLEFVQRVFAVCLDYDKGETIEAATELWGGFRGLLHTTRKHTDEKPRFRVVLPLKRPVSPFEFSELWERMNVHAGGKLDPAPKDPSRFWYLPGVGDHEGASFQAVEFKGEPLDPDEWLAKPLPAPKPLGIDYRHHDDLDAIERRASAYLAKIPGAISGSGGHQTTWEAALYLAKGFGLSEEQTFRLLWTEYNPRCQPPWSEKEIRHKAENACRAKAPDGFKLNTDRDWTPRASAPRDLENWDEYYQQQCAELGNEEEPDTEAKAESEPVADPSKTAVERYGLLSQYDLLVMCYEAMQTPRLELGVPTGNQELDEAIGKYRRGNVTILGAKRSFGKTSCSIMTCKQAQANTREDGEPFTVLAFAGEDSAMMYAKRFMALTAGINATRLRDLECTDADKVKATHAVELAPRLPFFLRTGGRPVEWIVKVIEDVAKEQRIDLVIVDYLQCIRAQKRQQDRRNEVTYVARLCVDAIKNVNAAGLLLSQLKRTERTKPEIEDLKESGDLEDMAEHILLGWKETHKDAAGNTAEERRIIVAKNKDGPGDVEPILMPFDTRTASFKPTYGVSGFTRQRNPDDDLFDTLDNQSRAAGDYKEEYGL